jgi:hypothetical protein
MIKERHGLRAVNATEVAMVTIKINARVVGAARNGTNKAVFSVRLSKERLKKQKTRQDQRGVTSDTLSFVIASTRF